MKRLFFFALFVTQICWGWGEVGHHLIARSAVEILKSHPSLNAKSNLADREALQSFLEVFHSKEYQEGHIANIPDTYWRNLDRGLSEEGTLLGSPSHYLDSEELLTVMKLKDLSQAHAQAKIPLTYAEAKKIFPQIHGFFKNVGSLPWRAQQFSELYSTALKKQRETKCEPSRKGELATRISLTFAGLLTHFTGDVSMPYHTTVDHDAIAVGQKGIHSYFEQDLVAELELNNLFAKITERARHLLKAEEANNETPTVTILRERATALYSESAIDHPTSALMMVLVSDSFSLIEKLRQLDYTYAIATLDEALKMSECQNLTVVKELKNQFDKLEEDPKAVFGKVKILSLPSGYHDKRTESACRRKPWTKIDQDGNLSEKGKTVAQWHEELIVERLALSAALTAEIWVQEWLKAGSPIFCSTYLYAHKPSFVSPTDSKCSGYALNEEPRNFIKKDGTSALNNLKNRRYLPDCISF